MRESAIERTVGEFCKRHGIITLKLAGAGARGQPDRLFLKGSKAVFVEFKAPGKKPTALQARWIKRLTDAGFDAFYVDDAQDGVARISKAFSLHEHSTQHSER
jgi:Holliday junction resolvase